MWWGPWHETLIVALDVDTEKEAFALIRETRKNADIYKVGPTLILRYGPEILKRFENPEENFSRPKIPRYSKHDARSVSEAAKNGVFQSHRPRLFLDCTQMRWSTSRPAKNLGRNGADELSGEDLAKVGFNRSPMSSERLAALAKQAKIDASSLRWRNGGAARNMRPNFNNRKRNPRCLKFRRRPEARRHSVKRASSGRGLLLVVTAYYRGQDPGLMAEQI